MLRIDKRNFFHSRTVRSWLWYAFAWAKLRNNYNTLCLDGKFVEFFININKVSVRVELSLSLVDSLSKWVSCFDGGNFLQGPQFVLQVCQFVVWITSCKKCFISVEMQRGKKKFIKSLFNIVLFLFSLVLSAKWIELSLQKLFSFFSMQNGVGWGWVVERGAIIVKLNAYNCLPHRADSRIKNRN